MKPKIETLSEANLQDVRLLADLLQARRRADRNLEAKPASVGFLRRCSEAACRAAQLLKLRNAADKPLPAMSLGAYLIELVGTVEGKHVLSTLCIESLETMNLASARGIARLGRMMGYSEDELCIAARAGFARVSHEIQTAPGYGKRRHKDGWRDLAKAVNAKEREKDAKFLKEAAQFEELLRAAYSGEKS